MNCCRFPSLCRGNLASSYKESEIGIDEILGYAEDRRPPLARVIHYDFGGGGFGKGVTLEVSEKPRGD